MMHFIHGIAYVEPQRSANPSPVYLTQNPWTQNTITVISEPKHFQGKIFRKPRGLFSYHPNSWRVRLKPLLRLSSRKPVSLLTAWASIPRNVSHQVWTQRVKHFPATVQIATHHQFLHMKMMNMNKYTINMYIYIFIYIYVIMYTNIVFQGCWMVLSKSYSLSSGRW